MMRKQPKTSITDYIKGLLYIYIHREKATSLYTFLCELQSNVLNLIQENEKSIIILLAEEILYI